MASLNRVNLIGHLGQDPEVRHMPNGDAVANVSLATSESWKDKNTGERKENTEWHRLVFYRRQAEIVGEYLKKGSLIYVEGRLQTRQWEKDGVKHYTTEIIASEMKMLGSKESGNNEKPSAPARQAAPSRPQGGYNQRPAPDGFDGFSDDIPF